MKLYTLKTTIYLLLLFTNNIVYCTDNNNDTSNNNATNTSSENLNSQTNNTITYKYKSKSQTTLHPYSVSDKLKSLLVYPNRIYKIIFYDHIIDFDQNAKLPNVPMVELYIYTCQHYNPLILYFHGNSRYYYYSLDPNTNKWNNHILKYDTRLKKNTDKNGAVYYTISKIKNCVQSLCCCCCQKGKNEIVNIVQENCADGRCVSIDMTHYMDLLFHVIHVEISEDIDEAPKETLVIISNEQEEKNQEQENQDENEEEENEEEENEEEENEEENEEESLEQDNTQDDIQENTQENQEDQEDQNNENDIVDNGNQVDFSQEDQDDNNVTDIVNDVSSYNRMLVNNATIYTFNVNPITLKILYKIYTTQQYKLLYPNTIDTIKFKNSIIEFDINTKLPCVNVGYISIYTCKHYNPLILYMYGDSRYYYYSLDTNTNKWNNYTLKYDTRFSENTDKNGVVFYTPSSSHKSSNDDKFEPVELTILQCKDDNCENINMDEDNNGIEIYMKHLVQV